MPKVNPIQSFYAGNLADAYVAKFSPTLSSLVYSTYLGGNGNDGVTGIVVDSSGAAHVTGVTFSSNFPVANAVQNQFQGGAFDAFVTKINPAGTALAYSTYLGGNDDDRGYRVRLDAAGNAYVAGSTESPNFPTASPYQSSLNGIVDAFVTKLTPTGTVSYSTFIGGSGLDGAIGLTVGPAGNAAITGFTSSTDFPTVAATQPANSGGEFDAFVTQLNTSGNMLDFSTYLGGTGNDSGFDIAVDIGGRSYVFGRTASTNFPTLNPLQPANSGGVFDLFVTKISTGAGFEGDVAPRPAGNNTATSTDVVQLRRFATGLDTPNPTANESQRADCAPRATSGDGVINSGDVVQGRRYSTGLDPLTSGAGPTSVFQSNAVNERTSSDRVVRVVPVGSRTGTVTAAVEMTGSGDEVAAGFTLEYDATLLSNPRVSLGDAAPNGAVLTINANEHGRIGILIDSTERFATSAVPRRLVMITFDVTSAHLPPQISLTSSLAAQSISDREGNSLAAAYIGAIVGLPVDNRP